jgi:hypothetical protein
VKNEHEKSTDSCDHQTWQSSFSRLAYAMNRLVVGIIIGVAVGAVLSVPLALLLFQPKLGITFPSSFQANDFLGLWYNVQYPPRVSGHTIIAAFQISENQGTYTIHTVAVNNYDWGTAVLTIDLPTAHAFYTFQSGSADLQLRLLNVTSIQVKESYEYQGTITVEVEEFKKSSTTSTLRITTQPKDQIIMEAYNFPIGGPLTMTLRNVGQASVNVGNSDFFISGVKATLGGSCVAQTLAPGRSCSAIVSLGSYASLVTGAAYPVKVVTPTGGIFGYSVIYGSSS